MEIEDHYFQARMKVNVLLCFILFIITCVMLKLASNIVFTSLVLARKNVSRPVISLSLDICLVVSDVLLVLAGIGGGISSSCTLAGIGGGISSSCTLASIGGGISSSRTSGCCSGFGRI